MSSSTNVPKLNPVVSASADNPQASITTPPPNANNTQAQPQVTPTTPSPNVNKMQQTEAQLKDKSQTAPNVPPIISTPATLTSPAQVVVGSTNNPTPSKDIRNISVGDNVKLSVEVIDIRSNQVFFRLLLNDGTKEDIKKGKLLDSLFHHNAHSLNKDLFVAAISE